MPFNSPNDVVVNPNDGSVWFTDPIYGFLEKDRFCDEFSCETGSSYLTEKSADIGWTGVYRVDRNTGDVNLITRYHRRPNGIAFTPNMQQLWISDSTVGSPSWTAYDVDCVDDNNKDVSYIPSKAVDSLSPATLGTEFGRTDELPQLMGGEGVSDGFKIDEWGYIWSSIPNGFAVIDPIRKTVICQILFGINTSNVAFGNGEDVYLTGKGGVWKIGRRRRYYAN